MGKNAPGDRTDYKRESELQTYAPSWVDRFTGWVDSLWGPAWAYYLGIWLFLFLIQTLVLWMEGAYPAGKFFLVHAVHAAEFTCFLALSYYLDGMAERALIILRPALKASEEEIKTLQYQLTNLPARPTLLASLAGVIAIILINVTVGTPSGFDAFAISPISEALTNLVYPIVLGVFGAFMYHTLHQLRVINRIYTQYTHVDLFRISPLYAFSRLTSFTAVSMTVLSYGWAAANPGSLSHPVSGGIILLITVAAFATFIWPMLGVHRLMSDEKERLLDEVAIRFEAAIAELHRRMDSGELNEVGEVTTTMSGLETEQNALNKIPTWPWQPETVRLLITTLLVPLGLWAVQFILQFALR